MFDKALKTHRQCRGQLLYLLSRFWFGVDLSQSIPSQLHFDTKFHFWKVLVWNWSQTRMNMVTCEIKRLRQQLLFPKKVQRHKLRTISAIPFPVEPFSAKVMEFECYRKRKIAEVDNIQTMFTVVEVNAQHIRKNPVNNSFICESEKSVEFWSELFSALRTCWTFLQNVWTN